MTKYSEADKQYMLDKYSASPTAETVELLAHDLETTPRSVIGVLAKMRVYRPRSAYKPKYGEAPVSKGQLVETLANLYELDVDRLRGLEASRKESLLYLVNALKDTFD
jgi:hypothetical protein